MENILVPLKEEQTTLLENLNSYFKPTIKTIITSDGISRYIALSELFNTIEELNNDIEVKNEEIKDLKKPTEPDYKDEVIAEQRIEERIVLGR